MKPKSTAVFQACVALAIVLIPTQAGAYTITLTLPDIQSQVEKNFPVTESSALYSLTLKNPRVELKEGSERVGLIVDTTMTALGIMATSGVVHIDGAIGYLRDKGEFLLEDAVARQVELEGISEPGQRQVAQIATMALREYFKKNPIYRLNPNDASEAVIKSALKSVKIQDGKLVVELGMPSF